uniref:Uncharacterized protein n=1 Tax=Oryza sativa subsp. japonica TaxID=39947 RepID=Q8LNA3_ORYSJ|nr:Hypothetical protein [Oryza sativa Japonica Group]
MDAPPPPPLHSIDDADSGSHLTGVDSATIVLSGRAARKPRQPRRRRQSGPRLRRRLRPAASASLAEDARDECLGGRCRPLHGLQATLLALALALAWLRGFQLRSSRIGAANPPTTTSPSLTAAAASTHRNREVGTVDGEWMENVMK